MFAFILTRAFAITALLVGAATMASAAPIKEKRFMGACFWTCLFKDTSAPDSVSSSSVIATPTTAAGILEIIELISPTGSTGNTDPNVALLNASPTPSIPAPLSTPSTTTIKVIELEVPTDSSDSLDDLVDALAPNLSGREYDPEAFLSDDA